MRRVVIMSGSFTIGASGAITAQDSSYHTGGGFTGASPAAGAIAKTASKTGRYDILTYRPWDSFVFGASIIGPTDAAFGNTAANLVGTRNSAPTSTTSQGQIQGVLASSGADTDFASGTIIQWWAYGYGK